MAGGPPLPPDAVLLTFDDGQDDHHRYVLPMLAERGLTGTFFVMARDPADGLTVAHRIHVVLAYLSRAQLREAVLDGLSAADRARFLAAEGEQALHPFGDPIDDLKWVLQRDLADAAAPILSHLVEQLAGRSPRSRRRSTSTSGQVAELRGGGHDAGRPHARPSLARLHGPGGGAPPAGGIAGTARGARAGRWLAVRLPVRRRPRRPGCARGAGRVPPLRSRPRASDRTDRWRLGRVDAETRSSADRPSAVRARTERWERHERAGRASGSWAAGARRVDVAAALGRSDRARAWSPPMTSAGAGRSSWRPRSMRDRPRQPRRAARGPGRVDAVYVALPHRLLADTAERVLAAGRAALVEKPMALDVPTVDRTRSTLAATQRSRAGGHVRAARDRRGTAGGATSCGRAPSARSPRSASGRSSTSRCRYWRSGYSGRVRVAVAGASGGAGWRRGAHEHHPPARRASHASRAWVADVHRRGGDPGRRPRPRWRSRTPRPRRSAISPTGPSARWWRRPQRRVPRTPRPSSSTGREGSLRTARPVRARRPARSSCAGPRRPARRHVADPAGAAGRSVPGRRRRLHRCGPRPATRPRRRPRCGRRPGHRPAPLSRPPHRHREEPP